MKTMKINRIPFLPYRQRVPEILTPDEKYEYGNNLPDSHQKKPQTSKPSRISRLPQRPTGDEEKVSRLHIAEKGDT